MIHIDIPGRAPLEISHVVLDYNGTIAVDGQLVPGLPAQLEALSRQVELHVLTADTYGTVRQQCAGLPVTVHTFPRAGAGACKAEIVAGLQGGVACLGNGFNDIPMFGIADCIANRAANQLRHQLCHQRCRQMPRVEFDTSR